MADQQAAALPVAGAAERALAGDHDGKGRSEVNTPRSADRAVPGELLHLVMTGMTQTGFDARPSEHGENERLAISCAAGASTLTISDHGHTVWDYYPRPPGDADPDLTADMATTLLTGRPGPHPRLSRTDQRDGISFRGLVGLELKARGLDVELAVYTDEDHFDAFAEIVASVPGEDDETMVFVTDGGCVTWTRSYWPETAAVPGLERSSPIADPASVAEDIVATVTRALSCLPPGGQGHAA